MILEKWYNNTTTKPRYDEELVVYMKRLHLANEKKVFTISSTWNDNGDNDAFTIAGIIWTNVYAYKKYHHIHYNVCFYLLNEFEEELVLTLNDCCECDIDDDLLKLEEVLVEIALNEEYSVLNGVSIYLEERYLKDQEYCILSKFYINLED